MKEKPIRVEKEVIYEDITYQVSQCEGCPVMETVTAEEQKEWVESGYGSVEELISSNIHAYKDWQSDC